MRREVLPELLDQLSPEDRRAIGSRRDLQKVNAWMHHASIMAGALRSAFARPPRSLVELGGGDGTQLLRLAELLAPEWQPAATLVDKQYLLSPETLARFSELGWRVEAVESDVFDWLDRHQPEPTDVCVANLFLHHFQDDHLATLLGRAAEQTQMFLACEPARDGLSLGAASLLWFIGCNEVTRNDARISVRAGFEGPELSSLWPGAPGWKFAESKKGLFTHYFQAQREPAPKDFAAETPRMEANFAARRI